MAYVEIRKNGKVVKRREVDEAKARSGIGVRLGKAGRVEVALGRPTSAGKYEVEVFPGSLDAAEGLPTVRKGRDDAAGALSVQQSAGHDAFPQIEGYRVTGRLGEGGMGVVWRAEQLGTKRQVALKLLGAGRFGSQKARARFEREVELAARLEHPGIARVYDSGVHHGAYFYAMELVDGVDLDRHVAEQALSQRQILELMRDVCEAVHHAHERGVIHRDLKPSNILVDSQGRPRVLDFGLAKTTLEEDEAIAISIEGEVAGTPAYMAPEQAAGRHDQMDARTDVYTLGVIMYRLLTDGQWPHGVTGSKYDILRRIIEEDVRRPRDACQAIDPEIEALLLKALAGTPGERYASSGDLGADIDNYLRGDPLTAKTPTALYFLRKRVRKHAKPLAVGLAVLVTAVIAGLAVAYWGSDDSAPGPGEDAIVRRERVRADAMVKREQARTFESSWQKIQLLDRNQGFGAKLDACIALRRQADLLFAEQSYTESAGVYDKWLSHCKGLQSLEANRVASIAARSKADSVRQAADQVEARDKVPSLWSSAAKLSRQAGGLFDQGDFAGAESAWTNAAEEYTRAQRQAPMISASQEDALAARERSRQAADSARQAGASQMSPGAWAKADASVRQALAAFDAMRFAQAKGLWVTATEQYKTLGQGAVQVASARNTYLSEAGKHNAAHLVAHAAEKWRAMLAAVEKADSAAAGGDFDRAAAGYRTASALFALAVTRARENKSRKGYEDLLAEAGRIMEALPAKDLSEAQNRLAYRALKVLSSAMRIRPADGRASGLRKRIESRIGQIVLDLGGGVTMKFVLIPAGKVTIPISPGHAGAAVAPGTREIAVDESFCMAVTEVTQEQYQAVTNSNPSRFKGPQSPVDNVSWLDASTFCRLFSAKAGRQIRLPTRNQWEYACRAGAATRYSFGDDSQRLDDFAWYRDNSIVKDEQGMRRKKRGVAGMKPNAWGLYDMHGNVAEWCLSGVLSGGSWEDSLESCEIAHVDRSRSLFSRNSTTGFRVMLSLNSLMEPAPAIGSDEAFASLIGEAKTALTRSPGGQTELSVAQKTVLRRGLVAARTALVHKPADREALALKARIAALLGRHITLDLGNNVTMKFVLIPAGKFWMGSPRSETDRDDDEGPQRQVTISAPFYMGVTEVTQAQWKAVMDTQPWEGKTDAESGPDKAASYISWNDAAAFCKALPKKPGRTIRLPTEAEWEYACRAGAMTKYSFGDDSSKLAYHAWCGDDSGKPVSEEYAHSVGVKKPNTWGLYDMHGNVWEWCGDRYANSYAKAAALDPKGPATGNRRVLRGGSWLNNPGYCRSASRRMDVPGYRNGICGVRLVIARGPGTDSTIPIWQEPATITPGVNKQLSLDLGKGVTMKLVRIEAGKFTMGSDLEQGRKSNEGPQRQVTISKPFYMGVTEVTQAQWKAVMKTHPWNGMEFANRTGANDAVNYVKWSDAAAFCAALSKKTGCTVRLPTEAEWEYACRAGTTTAFHFGDDSSMLGDYTWHGGGTFRPRERHPHPVGTKKPNGWGLYDMHGNVSEWCSNWWADSHADVDARDPKGPATGQSRVYRGGSWNRTPQLCRAARRQPGDLRSRYPDVGLRVVVELGSRVDNTAPVRPKPKTTTPGDNRELWLDLGKGVTMNLVRIEAGKFTMGSPGTEKGRKTNEGPQRLVTISTPFYMGVTEVTQAQWKAVMTAQPWNGLKYASRTGADAVNYISWNDAAAFCAALSKKTGRTVRLPAEAEWEYACRAGTTTMYSFGDDPSKLGDYAWHDSNAFKKRQRYPHPVGTKRPNAWGLYDMHGNVFEWCSDWWTDSYAKADTRDPKGPPSALAGAPRVLRGGSWDRDPQYCRTAWRLAGLNSRHPNVGFRVVVVSGQRVDKTVQELNLATGVTMKFVRIEAGMFTMGSDKPPPYAKPAHQVTIGKAFYMGMTEVTQAQWQAVRNMQPWKRRGFGTKAGDDHAANYISWHEATAFCKALSKKTGRTVRLPTEAEWEYACRAGTTTAYSFGDDSSKLGDYAWYGSDGSQSRYARSVGAKKPNAWGLYDMHGNVEEWCADWYADSYPNVDARDPRGPATGKYRVLRGGGWQSSSPNSCLAGSRTQASPDRHGRNIGLRVVLESDSRADSDVPVRPKPATTTPGKNKKLSLTLGRTATMELVRIEAGKFTMGSPANEKDRKKNEGPQRQVTISRPFYMAITEVTQGQYAAVMGKNPSRFKGNSNPVETVSWNDAVEFCKASSKMTGRLVRLPTEAEWEYACRAGMRTRFNFGDDAGDLGDHGWYKRNSMGRTHSTGRAKPNGWGLYDMHGNVGEWCSDWHSASYTGAKALDPKGPKSGDRCVLRGGSWLSVPGVCRSAYRYGAHPSNRHSYDGFRVVVELSSDAD